jgi:protein-S-isoprenylcysteine O-methyltransferase Ste14
VLLLPFTVVIVVPVWIASATSVSPAVPASLWAWASCVAGLVALAGGGTLFVTSLRLFHSDGDGTLAPWDPPSRLVVRGPYAHVRNPMISGVVILLLAEGLLLRSVPHLAWAGGFFLLNAAYIPLAEEPGLRARFGGEYDAYARSVPRLVPRLRPWRHDEPG